VTNVEFLFTSFVLNLECMTTSSETQFDKSIWALS